MYSGQIKSLKNSSCKTGRRTKRTVLTFLKCGIPNLRSEIVRVRSHLFARLYTCAIRISNAGNLGYEYFNVFLLVVVIFLNVQNVLSTAAG